MCCVLLMWWVILQAAVLTAFGKGFASQSSCSSNHNDSTRGISTLLRRTGAHEILQLEVYYSTGVCNFSSLAPNARVRNPSCELHNASLFAQKFPALELMHVKLWKPEAHGPQYYLEKAVFRVITEEEGYIQCKLETQDPSQQYIESQPFLLSGNEPQLIIETSSPPGNNLCLSTGCSTQVLRQLTRGLKQNLSSDGLYLAPLKVHIRTDGSLLGTFRATATALRRSRGSLEAADGDFLRRLRGRAAALRALRPRTALRVDAVRSARFCHAEDAGAGGWPTVRRGQAVLPAGACGAAEPRFCVGDLSTGARWGPAAESQPHCTSEPAHSRLLRLLAAEAEGETAQPRLLSLLPRLNEVLAAVPAHSPLSAPDVWHATRALLAAAEAATGPGAGTGAVRAVGRLLALSGPRGGALRAAQAALNTSNGLLDALGRILDRAPLAAPQELVVTEHLITLIADIGNNARNSSIRGLAVKAHDGQEFHSEDVILLPTNASLEWLLTQDVSAAVLLPEYLTRSNHNRLVFTVFRDPTLFGSEFRAASGPVLSVSLDGHEQQLQEPVLLLFGRHNNESATKCGFWDFQAQEDHGAWSEAGCTLAAMDNSTLDICVCTHFTHFGKLLYGADDLAYLELPSGVAELSIVTVVGCSLSLAGLAGVFLSAALLPRAGSGPGRAVQLQLCMAQALLMLALLWDVAADTDNEPSAACLARGLLLHQSVLALGLWSLATALHQHRRLTRPFEALKPVQYFLPVSTLAAWGVPACVWGSLLAARPSAYSAPSCYPSGYALLITVVAPLASIIMFNTALYLQIIWSVFRCGPAPKVPRDNLGARQRMVQRLVSSAYLFTLMGLTWLFGFLRWEYLFCTAASLQGVSHFVFCVLLDRGTRRSWTLYSRRKRMMFEQKTPWFQVSQLSKRSSSLSATRTSSLPSG